MTERLPIDRAPIEYPYMHEQGEILYVDENNFYMQFAKEFARQRSLDKAMPNSSIVVLNGEIIGAAANGSDYHDNYGCERVRLNIPTGQGYELCEGCSPKNHGEPKAVADAQEVTGSERLDGAEVYLWGHWWCCEPCWQTMIDSGVSTVYLLEDSEKLFNKEHPDNIIGRQFES